MGEALRERLKQGRFDSPIQEALLNLLVAANWLREGFDRMHAEQGISTGQYNVLRILKGVHPQGYARCEIAQRMIDRAPDLTRMIDRLVELGLVERVRSEQDRRRSIARITRRGLDLVERMQPTVAAFHRTVAARLTREDAEALSRICEGLYGGGETG